jgi:excisionase family DNA binding protein
MSELLTTKELQAILQVDRTTIYRMADSGRLPAIKVGNQWRFPRQQVEAWLQRRSFGGAQAGDRGTDTAGNIEDLFPLACVQLIQDSFADALGVMMLVTDLEGNLITQPSNPCGLFTAAEASPTSQERCLNLWVRLASDPSLAPRFQRSHLGLLCARGLVRVGSEIKAMLVVGGIAPDVWPPGEAEIQRIAQDLDLDAALIRTQVDEVHRLSREEQASVLPFVQRIADIFAHIAGERQELHSRLHRIAEITRL